MIKYNFDTPNDFLKELKVLLKNEKLIIGDIYEEFFKITEEELKQVYKEYPELLEQYNLHEAESGDLIIKVLLEILEPSIEEEELKRIKSLIAFGAVSNMSCNALCVKSPDNKYAILFYDGLFQLINNFMKLIFASIQPEEVIWCSAGNPKNLLPADYGKFAEQLIENYKKTGIPFGVTLKFSSDINLDYGERVILQELFVLCHELGHFFNGDLDNTNNFYHLSQYNLKIFEENKEHALEFKADLTGYALFEKIALKEFKISRKHLLLALIPLFNTLALITQGKSKSHPNPIDRLLNIVRYFFGENDAKRFEETYESREKFKEYFQDMG